MRIALVTDTYAPQVNGVTTVCRRIIRTLTDAGHAAAIVAPRYPDGGGEDDGAALELRVRSLPFPPYPSIRLSVPRYRDVARFLDACAPDVLHAATEGPLGAVGRRYALERGIPLVTSYHTHFPQYARYYGGRLLEPLVWRWLVGFHRPARLTHTPGEAVHAELVRRGIERAVVWGRGVDTNQFTPTLRDPAWRRWLAGADDAVIVLHVGRLAAEKNVDVLIESFRLARERLGPRVTFIVAGDGPRRRRVAGRLPFARMIGFLDPWSLARLYASADLCVLPSFTETCGLVALEAMASGIPVVAADAGGLRESVRHGQNGLLAAPHDATGFAAGIVALASDDAGRRALAEAARRTAVDRDTRGEDAELLAQYAALAASSNRETQACAA